MTTATRLGAYALGLLVVFAGAAGLGKVAGPLAAPAAAPPSHGASHGGHGESGAQADAVPGGLQVAQDGYRLKPVSPRLTTGAASEFAFQILGPDGAPVTRYTPTHERDLHLIVVRRDLAGFQHVHPTLGADGTWRIPIAVPAPGQYRAFADFQPAGRAKGLTLGVDLPAAGEYVPSALPAPSRTATVDGYTVELTGDLAAGRSSKLTLRVSRDGRPVTDLQPYLGAYGHLVALRDGDLAYLHVHPDGAPGDGRTPAGPELTFYAEVPSDGAYRLYLDFRHNGQVRTAEFTAVAGDNGGVPQPSPTTAEPSPTGHGHSDGQHN
jgi:hypothetical protein